LLQVFIFAGYVEGLGGGAIPPFVKKIKPRRTTKVQGENPMHIWACAYQSALLQYAAYAAKCITSYCFSEIVAVARDCTDRKGFFFN
jgi:hypothetical protein